MDGSFSVGGFESVSKAAESGGEIAMGFFEVELTLSVGSMDVGVGEELCSRWEEEESFGSVDLDEHVVLGVVVGLGHHSWM